MIPHPHTLIEFDTLPSTNEWAKAHLDTFSREGLTLISAASQTAGRGRFGRTWFSPPHLNLYATFCFFIEPEKEDSLALTHVLALCVAKLLENEGLLPTLKWPNDILIKGKKIAGILCETLKHGDKLAIVIGLGLNINMGEKWLGGVDQPATSLLLETQKEWDIGQIKEQLTTSFWEDLGRFLQQGFTPFLPLYTKFRQ